MAAPYSITIYGTDIPFYTDNYSLISLSILETATDLLYYPNIDCFKIGKDVDRSETEIIEGNNKVKTEISRSRDNFHIVTDQFYCDEQMSEIEDLNKVLDKQYKYLVINKSPYKKEITDGSNAVAVVYTRQQYVEDTYLFEMDFDYKKMRQLR